MLRYPRLLGFLRVSNWYDVCPGVRFGSRYYDATRICRVDHRGQAAAGFAGKGSNVTETWAGLSRSRGVLHVFFRRRVVLANKGRFYRQAGLQAPRRMSPCAEASSWLPESGLPLDAVYLARQTRCKVDS